MKNHEKGSIGKWILRYGITFIIGLIIALIVFKIQGLFDVEDINKAYIILCNGFFVSSVILIGIGLLFAINAEGFFDIIGYGKQRSTSLFYKGIQTDREIFNNFFEYKEKKSKKRKPRWFVVVVGLVYLLLAIIFNSLYTALG